MLARLHRVSPSVRLSYLLPVLVGLVALAAQWSMPGVPPRLLVLAALFDATVVSALVAWCAAPRWRRRPQDVVVFAARGLAVAALVFPALRGYLWLDVLALAAVLLVAVTGLRSPLPPGYAELDDVERAYAWWGRLHLPARLVQALVYERLLLRHLFVRPHLPEGVHFGTRRDATTGAMIGAFVFVSVVEGLLMHVLLAPYVPVLAWSLTALSALGVVWLLAFGRALATRPVTVGARRVYLRVGLLWTVSVPRADVVTARPFDVRADAGVLRLAVGNEPNVMLAFSPAVSLLGVYGAQRVTSGVALHVDDPVSFLRALTSTGGSAGTDEQS